MIDRAKAVAYANQHWFQPCKDGVVWTANVGMNVAAEARKLKLDPTQWVGRFLFYQIGNTIFEGLFLVPLAEADVKTMKARGFESKRFPNKRFICSWSDKGKDSTEGQTPPYTGLNDCTHFTSSCVVAGGPPVASLGAGQFVNMLRARDEIKTLCLGVDKEAARRIINRGPLAPGDVIAFSRVDGFRHAILYLGNRTVAAHTHCNHPDGPAICQKSEAGGGTNNWEISSTASHPLVTLLHFTQGDLPTTQTPWVPGWWRFVWRGQAVFYHFDPAGRVRWTRTQPPSPNAPPPPAPDGKGYWFVRNGSEISICWTQTGSFEQLRQTGPLAVTGTSNGTDLLAGIRLTL